MPNPPMMYSKQGISLTERFEGCRLQAYLDSVGKPTIGYGHTHGVKLGDICTAEQAEQWLIEDTNWAVGVVNALVQIPLTQNQFDALVDFTFNLGSGNFQHSNLLRLVNEQNFTLAASEFEKWDKAGGQVVAGLLRRRQAEQQEFNG